MKKMKVKMIKQQAVEGRLHCFGDFDANDPICLKYCALNVNCAIARHDYFAFQVMDDSVAFFMRFNKHD